MNNTLIPLHPHTNIFALEVPDDAIHFYISGLNFLCAYKSYGYREVLSEQLPGKYNLIGTVKNKVIDFDCEPYIKRNPYGRYRDYKTKLRYDYLSFQAQDSFLSLMESNGLDVTKKYVILSKTV